MSSPAEAFLRSFHDADPGGSPRCFARGRLPDGASTYARLARSVGRGEDVLDLCCGDGWLLAKLTARGARPVGVDLSPGEVAAAQQRGMHARVARAQALPFPRRRFDAVVSSWALMLVDDLDVVLAEVLRVLRPGGRFHAIIGTQAPEVPGNRWPDLVHLIREVPRREQVSLGDPRARDPVALQALLDDVGFTHVTTEVHAYDLSGTAEQAARLVDSMYDAALMTPAHRGALAERVHELLDPIHNPLYFGVMEVTCSAPAD